MAQLAVSGEKDDANERGDENAAAKASSSEASCVDDRAGLPIDAVSRSLRQAYESTLLEDVPDSLMDLLRKLD